MKNIRRNREECVDKVYGCWIGKNIGGPFEGERDILDVTGYTMPVGEPLTNDDLDLQFIWLKAVTDRGKVKNFWPKTLTALTALTVRQPAATICARSAYEVRVDAVHSIITLDCQRAPGRPAVGFVPPVFFQGAT